MYMCTRPSTRPCAPLVNDRAYVRVHVYTAVFTARVRLYRPYAQHVYGRVQAVYTGRKHGRVHGRVDHL